MTPSTTLQHTDALLDRCASDMGKTPSLEMLHRLNDWERSLRTQLTPVNERAASLPPEAWEGWVDRHRAHRHSWYGYLEDVIDANGFAQFLLENKRYPSFTPMLERLLEAQLTAAGKAAIERNLADEQVPVPHSTLMARLMSATAARADSDLRLEVFPSLVDRTLVFYYGVYCDPWHLVGSLFATELMAHHRVTRMGRGLERLGLTPHELEFVTIHADCDEQHAREWLECVIVPSIEASAEVLPRIACGMAACLETSATYLDDLQRRALGRACDRTRVAL